MKAFSVVLAILVLAAVLLPAPVEAAVLRNCGKEIEGDFNKFKLKMRHAGFGKNLNTKINPKMVKWLEEKKAAIIKHEEAHKNAAGKWGKKIIYKQFVYWNVKYAVAGCVPLKTGITPDIALKSALAPAKPSSIDQKLAARAEKALRAEKGYKNARSALAKCKKVPHQTKRNRCLKKYKKILKGHYWLKVKEGNW